LGALVGGWLVARWCLGLVLIAESVCGVAWGLLHDVPETGPRPVPNQGVTLAEIWDRARKAA
jgi:hypothetical protein